MKTFLIVTFLAAVVVAFAGAAANLTILHNLGAVIAVLTLLAAYGVDQLNTYLEGEEK